MTILLQTNISPSSDPLFYLIDSCLLFGWFFPPIKIIDVSEEIFPVD